MAGTYNPRLLQNIFKSYFPSYHRKHKLAIKDLKAADAIMHCRTPELGYSCFRCPNGHEERRYHHSCRHRSCVLCAGKSRHDWLEAQKQRLLPCAHYHVVFTLPHEYLPLWHYNRAWFTKHFFQACRDTLLQLLTDPRYLGATPGLLMTLHTWGRQLNPHPHIHCLVTGGGLTPERQWRALENDFLLPVRVVKSLFKGKLQARIDQALKARALTLPKGTRQYDWLRCHRALHKKEWSLRIMDRYDHGKGVVLYLSRYLKGGPLHPQQIQYCDNHRVVFRYKDHRDQKIKRRSLPRDEFIRRLLWHVPVPGVHVIRHYGLYASRALEQRNRCRAALGADTELPADTGLSEKDAVHWACRACGEAFRPVYSIYPHRRYENSYRKESLNGFVQQDVQVGHRMPATVQRIPP